MNTLFRIPLLLTAALLSLTTAQAEEPQWEWAITPYIFLPAAKGDATVAGQTVPVDATFSDVWQNFDVMALAARGEGWKGDWGFVLDGTWTDLSTTAGPGDSISIDIEQWYVEALAGWRQKSDSGGLTPAHWDLTAGLRYNSFTQQIGLPPGSLGGTEEWVDLMLGTRGIWKLNDSFLFYLRGDIGGFGISDVELTASGTGGFGWMFHENWVLDLGYRYYYLDYMTERDDGAFGFDGNLNGLWLGITWRQ